MRRVFFLLVLMLVFSGFSYGESDYVYLMVGDGEDTYVVDKNGHRIDFEALKGSIEDSFYYENAIFPEMKMIEKEVNGTMVEVPTYYFGVKTYKDHVIAEPINDKVIENDLGYLLLNGKRFIQIDPSGNVLSTTEVVLPEGSRIVDTKGDTYIYELLSGGQGRINKNGEILEVAEAAKITYLEDHIIHYHVNYGLIDESMVGIYGVQIKDEVSGHSIVNASEGTMGHRVGNGLFAGRNSAGQWYLIDYLDGQVSPRPISKMAYVNIGQESEGLIAFAVRNKSGKYLWGYMDRTETVLIPPKYSRASSFRDSFAIVEENGKKGLINKNGDYVILPELDKITRTYNGDQLFYSVKLGDYSGLMDHNFKWLVSPSKYAYANLSQEGIYIVKRSASGNTMGLIDLQGNTLIPCEYREISKLDPQRFVVNLKDGCGIYNVANQEFLKLPYKMARNAGYDFIAISNDGLKWGVANVTGDEIIGMIYDRIGMFRDFNTKKIKS